MRSDSRRGAAEDFTSSRAIPSPSGKVFFNQKVLATAPFRAHRSGVESRPVTIPPVVNPSLPAATAATAPNPGNRALSHLPGEFTELKGGFDFRRLWHSLVERIWIVALCVLAGFFLALGYLARTPKLYQGHTVLEVEFQEPTLVTTEDSTARMRSTFLAS